MNFKEKYNTMNEHIQPQKTVKSDTLNAMSKAKKTPYKMIAGIAAAACIAIVLTVLGAAGVFSGKAPENQIAQQTPPNATATARPTAATVVLPEQTPPPVCIELTGAPVKYSELGLNLPSVDYPDIPHAEADIAAFSEDDIMRSKLIIDGTVQQIRFNHYFEYETTAVYEVRIGDILYSETDMQVGDIILIEQNLYMSSPCIYDSIVGLKPGGRYILPIYEIPEQYAYVSKYMHGKHETDADVWAYISEEAQINGAEIVKSKSLESRYSIIYPFMPPIQVVPNVGYLFPSGWSSLVTDDATPVEMDVSSDALYYDFYLRDEGLITDFKKLIGKYVNEEYRSANTYHYADEYTIENGRVKTTENLAYLYTQKHLSPFIMVDSSWMDEEEKNRLVKLTLQAPYPILITDFEIAEDESDGWTAEYSQYTQSGFKNKVLLIPEYIDLSTDTQLIAAAREYLTPTYQSLAASVRLNEDSMLYWVDFEDANGDVIIRAEIRLVGDIMRYTIFQSR